MASLSKDSTWFQLDLNLINEKSYQKVSTNLYKAKLFRNWPIISTDKKQNSLSNAAQLKEGLIRIRSQDKPFQIGLDYTWKENPFNDRNWRFWFHSLAFLDYLIVAYRELKDIWYLNFIKKLTRSWLENNFTKQCGDHHMAWHDHAIAIRLRQFTKILIFLSQNKIEDKSYLSHLYQAIYLHTRILTEDEMIKYYDHNHGLEQAYAAYLSHLVAEPTQELYPQNYKEKNIIWLQCEMKNMISTEGVQTENSPSYHDLICSEVYRIDNCLRQYSQKDYLFSDKIRNESLEFLMMITQPDGFLAPLGDTTHNTKSLHTLIPTVNHQEKKEYLPSYPFYLYAKTCGNSGVKPQTTRKCWPKSGYFIQRNKWDNKKANHACHLIIKCGYLSPGHRHHDDGHILLYGYGEPWLIDAGRYSYLHDNNRNYILGSEAHNVASPASFKASIPKASPEKKTSMNLEKNTITCTSFMYQGYLYKRIFEINRTEEFTITDHFEINSYLTYYQHMVNRKNYISRFMFPPDKDIRINDNNVVIASTKTKSTLIISFEKKPFDIKIISGETPYGKSFYTTDYKKLTPAKSVYFYFGNTFKRKVKQKYSFVLSENKSEIITAD